MYWFSLGIFRFLSRFLFHVTCEGAENLPEKGGYVVVSNHHSLVDPVFIALKLKRQIYFMAKAELFHNKVFGWWLRKCGAFAVERGSGDRSSLDHAVDIVRRGDLLGIFPEGTRSKNGVPSRPKSGAAYIAGTARCGIVPCAVIFDGDLKVGKRIHVVIGKPIEFEELGWTGEKSALKCVSKRIMAEIIALMGDAALPPEQRVEKEGAE